MDLISEFYSTLLFICEEFTQISPRYLPAIIANTSTSLVFYVTISLLMFFFTVMKSTKKAGQKFDISVTDEVTFESRLSQEEIDEGIAKNSRSYIPLNKKNPKAQIESFLSGPKADDGDKKLMSRMKQARQNVIRKKIEDEMTEEEKLSEEQIKQQQLEKIFALLRENEDTFGKTSKEELQKQCKMYTK